MHAKIFSAITHGVVAHLVEVEVDISFGLVNFYIVGLPDTAIKESAKRVQSALKNSGLPFPAKRVTVNLAPADLKKVGTLFDLPIAIGILIASNNLSVAPDFLHDTCFIGELSLDGSIRPVRGVLSIASDAQMALGKKRLIVPRENAQEAALIPGLEVFGFDHLVQLLAFLKGETVEKPVKTQAIVPDEIVFDPALDFAQVKGQQQVKRAMQIAAAGRHNLLLVGSPGSGKTMLAKRLPTIMPAMTFTQLIEASKIYSITGKLHRESLITSRPFRSPHHTISQAGLIGGGSYPQPGEISHAHHGILFLDELTEFKRTTLEALRQPLEDGQVIVARANQTVKFPASFLLVAALNPCPCGFFGDKKRACSCSRQQIDHYLQKLSGPLLDRIDLQINVTSIDYSAARSPGASGQSSADLFVAVKSALMLQKERFGCDDKFNSAMTPDEVDRYCHLTSEAEAVMQKAFEVLLLSMRGYHKILKVARTIADLDNAKTIEVRHVQEATMYRSLDQFLDRQRLA